MRPRAPTDESARDERDAIADDDARLAMVRQVKGASLDRRVEMFERLCADAAWIKRHAVRVK